MIWELDWRDLTLVDQELEATLKFERVNTTKSHIESALHKNTVKTKGTFNSIFRCVLLKSSLLHVYRHK